MSERTRLKRSAAPKFWKFPRKSLRFAVLSSPGPHPRDESYPLAVFVRDVLKLTKTSRETEAAVRAGSVSVDGVVRREPDFPIGLMDVVEVPSIEKIFRIVPIRSSPIAPLPISESERYLKLCKIKSKVTVRGGRIQLGFHDGRSLIVEDSSDLRSGDVCLLEVPSQRLLKSLKTDKGSLVLVEKGAKVGLLGRILEVKPGTFNRPTMAEVAFEEVSTELPTDLLFTVGVERPLITVSRSVG